MKEGRGKHGTFLFPRYSPVVAVEIIRPTTTLTTDPGRTLQGFPQAICEMLGLVFFWWRES